MAWAIFKKEENQVKVSEWTTANGAKVYMETEHVTETTRTTDWGHEIKRDANMIMINEFTVNGKRLQQPNYVKRNIVNGRSEEHTSELQSRGHLVCRLQLEKKKSTQNFHYSYPHLLYQPHTLFHCKYTKKMFLGLIVNNQPTAYNELILFHSQNNIFNTTCT